MDRFVVFCAGACLGSFINVVIYRLPRGQSLVFPGSRCPRCRKALRFYDNIPVFSWLLLAGRCRFCHRPISPRYPVVELIFACLSAALWTHWQPYLYWSIAAILAAGVLMAVALIDWDTFLIPDELSLGLLAAGWLAAPINPFFAGSGPVAAVLLSLAGSLIGFVVGWVTAAAGEKIFKKEAMGGGDIKLLAAVGAWGGGLGAFDCLMIGSLIGSIYGAALMARGRLRRCDPIAFGPFLSAGAIFNLFWLLPLDFLARLTW
ncbi:MAG: hypothetical protein A3J74_03140 [Elusimicrobia bacterium RIFCSPHIGHO2_02_FULL_57_9]|nr:MAG: hypothetical protein A3J74_03140 [Elusimicrobia bacterium RIFCSPHIGHO2_02_FULL_57_9]